MSYLVQKRVDDKRLGTYWVDEREFDDERLAAEFASRRPERRVVGVQLFRWCECGCGVGWLLSTDSRRFASNACRQRAYRERRVEAAS